MSTGMHLEQLSALWLLTELDSLVILATQFDCPLLWGNIPLLQRARNGVGPNSEIHDYAPLLQLTDVVPKGLLGLKTVILVGLD